MKVLKTILLLGVIVLVALVWARANEPEKATEYRLCIVQDGDTLWDIANEVTPDSRDIRDTIDEIEEKNDLVKGYIYEGQRLQVPVYEEK